MTIISVSNTPSRPQYGSFAGFCYNRGEVSVFLLKVSFWLRRCRFTEEGCSMYLFKEDIGQISIRHSNQPRMHCLDS